MTSDRLNLAELKAQSPKDLLSLAEELEIENASTMRKGDMMFAILKERAEDDWVIGGDGVLEVLQDGFGFLRSPEANYLPGPDDIYVSPDMIRQFALRTGDTVEGVIRAQAKEFDPAVEPYIAYICNTSGKRIRPVLSFLSGGA
ncbi:MAG: Rho termination factor N-terminal domain-containing protein, partial [Pseudomonadota bacterium]